MLNTIVIASALAVAASASIAERDAPVTVTNTVTVTSCPASVKDCAAATKYITVPCGEQPPAPSGAPAPAAHPSEKPAPAPPAPTGGPAAAAPPTNNKSGGNGTASKPEGQGCPAYGCGTELPIATASPASTVAVPSKSAPVGSSSASASPSAPIRVSGAAANSVSLAAGVAVFFAAFSLF